MRYLNNKKILSFYALIFSISLIASDVDVSVKPQPLVKGKQAQLELSSSAGDVELLDIPEIDGIKWLGKGGVFSQTEIINFKKTSRVTVIYNFFVEKEGEIKFPPLKVKTGKKKIVTDPFTVDAVSPRISFSDENAGNTKEVDDLGKYLMVRAVPLSDRKEFYVGEEIPLEVIVYTATGIRCELSWPEIKAQNLIFRDFSQINKENANFAGYQNTTENFNGKTFNCYRFKTIFKSLSAEPITGNIEVNTKIRIPKAGQRRSFFDDFFFDPFSEDEIYQHTLTCPLPEIKILPLPEKTTEDAIFTGLIGEWNLSFALQDSKFKKGEGFTLKININGRGGIDNLRAPDLKIDGFRVYPPEVVRHSKVSDLKDNATIEYLMVPLSEGNAEIVISLLTFSSSEKKYKKWDFSKKINVGKGDDNVISAVVSSNRTPNSQKNNKSINEDLEKSADILYLKKNKYGAVIMPIWKNKMTLNLVIPLVAALILIVNEIVGIISRRNLPPDVIRRKEALRKKHTIIKKIKKLNDNDVNTFIREELCPWLNDLKSLPPGTSPEELAKLIEDKELRDIIEDAAFSIFASGNTGIKAEENKRKILNALRKISCFIALSFVFFNLFGDEAKQQMKTSIKEDPYALYDSGDFTGAISAFSSQSLDSANDPYVLYNIGCCFYRLGRLVDALYCFEKASLLLPRDSDILENLNHTRRKLELKEKALIESSADLLTRIRNWLRPDEWLFLVSISFSASLVLLSFRRKIAFEYLFITMLVLLAVVSIAIFAVITQLSTDYSKNSAIIYNKASNIFVLPSENSEKIKIKLNAGQTIKVVEERSDWTRIRINASEGWIKNENIKMLWN